MASYLFKYRDNFTFTLPWNRVLMKLFVIQLFKKFPAFYGTRNLCTMSITVYHWIPS